MIMRWISEVLDDIARAALLGEKNAHSSDTRCASRRRAGRARG
jgi:hypothetical protein